jgi:hypothetical protein
MPLPFIVYTALYEIVGQINAHFLNLKKAAVKVTIPGGWHEVLA